MTGLTVHAKRVKKIDQCHVFFKTKKWMKTDVQLFRPCQLKTRVVFRKIVPFGNSPLGATVQLVVEAALGHGTSIVLGKTVVSHKI